MLITALRKEKKEAREKGRFEGMLEGERKGINKGKIEGKMEGKMETALAMLSKGMKASLISEITGISRDDVFKLKSTRN